MSLPSKHPNSNSYDYSESLDSQDLTCCKSIGDAFQVYAINWTFGWERELFVFKLFCQSGERKLKYFMPIQKEQLAWRTTELNLESLVCEDSWLLLLYTE